jgi:DNA-binding MarR family transcriptional regulator
LLEEIEENPESTIQELSNRLQYPWSTIQEHMKKIETAKKCKQRENYSTARKHLSKTSELDSTYGSWFLEVLLHSPYSPDIAPSDYYLFRLLEHFLKNKFLKNLNDVKMILEQFFSPKN